MLSALLVSSVGVRVARASLELHGGAAFDERYTLQNAVRLVAARDFAPRHAFYTSLSYLPQAAVLAVSDQLHRRAGVGALAVFGARRDYAHLTPTAYLLSRLVNVGFGAASLLALFLLGRRLDSPEVGLLAAAILAAAPRHAISSAHIKPDILVLLLTVVGFGAALAAAGAEPATERRRFLAAGGWLGLAAAAKLSAVIGALPIAAAAVLHAAAWRRAVVRALWSVLTAAVVFVALNPFLSAVWDATRHNAAAYAARAAAQDSDRWTVVRRAGEFLWRQHGVFLLALVAVGLAILVWNAIQRPSTLTERRRDGVVLLLTILLGWSALLPALTPIFRAQNYLLVLPFTALAAAWGTAVLWRQALPRPPGLLTAAACLATLLLIVCQFVGRADTDIVSRLEGM